MPKRIRLNGFVGVDLTPDIVSEQLDVLGGEEIVVDLSTTGGLIYDGLEIYNRIADYPGKKTGVLGGLVASIGSYISTAFDFVQARKSSVFMIHNAQGMVIGDFDAMRKEADILEGHTDHIAQRLSERAGITQDEIREMLADDGTWLYSQEIVDAGFADELIDSDQTGESQNRAAAIARASAIRSEDLKRVAALFTMRANAVQSDGDIDGRHVISASGQETSKSRSTHMATKQEVLDGLKNLRANNEITLREIVTAGGWKENVLMTDEAREAVALVKKFADAGVKDIEAEYKRLKKSAEDGEKAKRDNELHTAFGPLKEKGPDGKEQTNVIREYAEQRYNGDTTIEDIKKDPVMQHLMAQRADYTSPQNRIGVVDGSGGRVPDATGERKTVTY